MEQQETSACMQEMHAVQISPVKRSQLLQAPPLLQVFPEQLRHAQTAQEFHIHVLLLLGRQVIYGLFRLLLPSPPDKEPMQLPLTLILHLAAVV